MKQLKITGFLFLAALMLAACGSDDDNGGTPPVENQNVNANSTAVRAEYGRLEFPRLKSSDDNIVLVHTTSDSYDHVNFAVEWSVSKKSQRWTCYEMHKGYGGSAGYYGTFEEDPDLPTAARFPNTSSMYSHSGFTRGHICPSADRQYSKEANRQTFYYTNMQPQYYNFNAGDNYTGVWVKMENQLRSWTNSLKMTDTIFVCKGGTIDSESQILQRVNGGLIVPKYFFAAFLKKTATGYNAIAFWFEHTNEVVSNVNLGDYVISVAELEQRTGIDFFCNLPDNVERSVENMSDSYIRTAWGLK